MHAPFQIYRWWVINAVIKTSQGHSCAIKSNKVSLGLFCEYSFTVPRFVQLTKAHSNQYQNISFRALGNHIYRPNFSGLCPNSSEQNLLPQPQSNALQLQVNFCSLVKILSALVCWSQFSSNFSCVRVLWKSVFLKRLQWRKILPELQYIRNRHNRRHSGLFLTDKKFQSAVLGLRWNVLFCRRFAVASQTRSSAGATAVRSPPHLSLVSAYQNKMNGRFLTLLVHRKL